MGYDVAVIGSGIGGLYAASILAREGLKVVVLERHTVAGGLLQCFRRGGELFPTGVHYLGGLAPGQVLWRYLKYAGVLDHAEFAQMDPDCFDRYSFPDFQVRIPSGHEAFEARLASSFPGERPALRRFIADMRETCSRFALYNLRPPAEGKRDYNDQRSLGEYLAALTKDERLRLALSANNILYGVPPEECPCFLHFLVFDSFLQGAWQVKGGSAALAAAFSKVLASRGAEVRTSAEVKEICVENDCVSGVRLAGGEVIKAKRVVFSGHTKHLFGLIRPQATRPAYRERILSLEETMSLFGVCLSLKGRRSPLDFHNEYLFAKNDVASCYAQELAGSRSKVDMVFCAGSCETESPNATITLLTPMSFKEVDRWKDSRLGSRPDDYRRMKEIVSGKIVEFVKSRIPEAFGDFKVAGAFSPLTMRDYVSAWDGSAYGIKKSIGQMRSGRILPRTRVKGLFLAGQNIEMSGIVGTVIGSVSCCSEMLGAEYLLNKISRETL